MANQGVFDVALVGLVAKAQEVEVVGVLWNYLARAAPGSRAGAGVKLVRAAPSRRCRLALMLDSRVARDQARSTARMAYHSRWSGSADLGQKRHDVEPGQLGSRLLPNLKRRAKLREDLHVFQVPRLDRPLHVGEGSGGNCSGQPVDDLGAPSLLRLPGEEFAPDVVVQAHQLLVDGQGGPRAGALDARLEVSQPTRVVGASKLALMPEPPLRQMLVDLGFQRGHMSFRSDRERCPGPASSFTRWVGCLLMRSSIPPGSSSHDCQRRE